MHPRLRRYAEPPSPRLLRHFLIGATFGLAALIGGHALFEALVGTPEVTCSVGHDHARSDR
jgi:hypothetical protein